jgi:hypothetical protein
MRRRRKPLLPLLPRRRYARWLCPRPGRVLSTRRHHRHRLLPASRPEWLPQAPAFSVANRYLTGVLKPDRAALRLVRRVDPAASRIKAHPASLPAQACIPADRVPNIPPVQDLPAPVPVVRADLAHVQGSEHVPALALRVRAVSAQVRAALRLQAKRRALLVLPDRLVAAAASSIPRPKKAR